MKNIYLVGFFLLSLPLLLPAQMRIGDKTLYGNEWIQYGQPYWKILVTGDGIHRIYYDSLLAVGFPIEEITAERVQLFHFGEQVPLYISATDTFAKGDFIEFYGNLNRSELDRFLYKNGETDMLNPKYSLFSDTAVFYLTIAPRGANSSRFQTRNNDLNNLPAKEEWFWEEVLRVFQNGMVQPVFGKFFLSEFERGEGYAASMDINQALQVDLESPARYAAGVNDSLEIRLTGVGTNPHAIAIRANDQILEEWTGSGHTMWLKQYTMNGTGDRIRINVLNQTGRAAVGYMRLQYPRNFNFSGSTVRIFTLSPAGQERYLEIEGFRTDGVAPILYDITNQIRITTTLEGNRIKIKIPASSQKQSLVLANARSGFAIVSSIKSVRFENYTQRQPTFVVISSEKLRNDGQGNDYVQAYAAYRASAAGGNHDTLVVNVEDLYEQFSYGIQRHPLAIRNFGHFFANRQSVKPYFFLIGKAREYGIIRNTAQIAAQHTFFVPTFGTPGADNLLLATSESNAPVAPLGRLSAVTPQEIKLYLDKVKDHEDRSLTAVEDRIWRKRILQFGGGNNAPEQDAIKRNLASMERELRSNQWGATVTPIFKTSTDPIQNAVSEVVQSQVNEGVGMMIFMGHASPNSFDIATDDPATYRNFRRYPFVVSLGCYSGQIHEGSRSIGENFVFQENKGAIAFLATTGEGELSALSILFNEFCKQQGTNFYHQSLGKALQSSYQRFGNQNSVSIRSLNQQLTLNGDPAMVITPDDFADYLPDISTVQLTPSAVNAQQDSLEFSFNILNAGKNQSEKILVEVERLLPNEFRIPISATQIDPPAYSAPFKIKLPVFGETAAGFNRLFVKVNGDKKIIEAPQPQAEENNILKDAFGKEGVEFFVYNNSIVPIQPTPFAIVGDPNVKLQASTTNAFDTNRQILFEIDTTSQFTNPIRHTQTAAFGGVSEWMPDMMWSDSVVYYWRVAILDAQAKDTVWNSSSFLYVANAPFGWNQSHFFQLQQNRSNNFRWNEERRNLQYIDNVKGLQVKTFRLGSNSGSFPGIIVDNAPWDYLPWDNPINNGIYVCVFDSVTVDPWYNGFPGKFGSRLPHPWAVTWAHFPYSTTDAEWRARAINFLQDTIPDGNYVLIYTVQTDSLGYRPQDWAVEDPTLGTSLLQVLEKEGATLIRNTLTEGAKPYVIFYKKGEKLIDEVLAPHRDSIILKNYGLTGRWDSGTLTSPRIGPAQNWKHFHWNRTDKETQDREKLNLIGIRADSTQSILFEDIVESSIDLKNIDAKEFPYLQLEYYTKDSLLRSTPQLGFWRVLYNGLPDAALHPATTFQTPADSMQQGQLLQIELAVSNIGNADMDSLVVAYTFSGSDGKVFQQIDTLGVLLRQNTAISKLSLENTQQLSGAQRLKIEANPANNPQELHRFNNVGFIDFSIVKDQRNPLLDVRFDGNRILDGDIVSAQPVVTIALKDENNYLLLNKPEFFNLILESPDPNNTLGTIQTAIPLTSDQLQFVPATEPGKKNEATLSWMPTFEQSGRYALIVQAQDASGNVAGAVNYKVNFEVITESKISNLFNYPNPFSTSTQFVYTLTGTEPPPHYQIQIMTISGRIVRELTELDLGPLRIGTHRTELAWDGTDQYGDRLANGVYLYRVIVKDQDGNDYEKHDTGTDRFFKNNIGKLIILR